MQPWADRGAAARIGRGDLVAAAVVLLLAAACGTLVARAGAEALPLCLSLIACGLILLEFRIGAGLLVLLMPLAASTLFPHAMFGVTGLNPLNLLLLATLLSWWVSWLSQGQWRHFVPRPLWWLYLLPLGLAAALGARHVDEIAPGFYAADLIAFHDVPGYLRDLLFKPLVMVVAALLVAAAARRTARPQWLLTCAVASVWVMSLIVVAFVVGGVATLDQLAAGDQREYLSPLGMHANELGRLYAFAFALLLFGFDTVRARLPRLAAAASLGLTLLALLLTFSRGAYVGVIVTVALYLLWRPAARGPALVALLLLAAVALPLSSAVLERAASGFGGGVDAVSAGRVQGLWLPLLPEALASPLWGHGLGSILWSEAMRHSGGGAVLGVTHPHNAYLQTLLDMGLLGLVAFGAYFTHVLRSFRRLAHDARLEPSMRAFFEGASAGLLGFLVTALVDSSFVPKPEHALLWFAIGMAHGLHRDGDDAAGSA